MMKAGFIGFMPRGLDFDGTIEALKVRKALGYSATEHATFLLQGDVKENKKKLDDIGMEALCVMFGMNGPYTEEVLKKSIDQAHQCGVERVAMFVSKCATWYHSLEGTYTYDDMMKEIEDMNWAAKELAKEGLVLALHNHDGEFQTWFKGKSVFNHMVDESEYLKFQIDTGWVLYGHNDPVEVMEYVGDKLYCIHIKDWIMGNTSQTMGRPGQPVDEQKPAAGRPIFVAPGTGVLPLKEVLKKADEMGMKHAIIEMDNLHLMDQEESLRCGYLNMKETGYVL